MTPHLDISTDGALGRIVLNRPQAINALDREMIDGIADTLLRWLDDPAIRAVLFEGSGPRGFCSGGDVRAARAHVVEGQPEAAQAYFAAEYRMNAMIADYSKPLIALSHGIVMGGGIGIAGHCRYRLTVAGSRFAMPESAIGFFGDVGVNAILAQAPLNRALLFLLSGEPVGAEDALALGLADAVIADDRIDAVRSALAVAARSSDPAGSIVGVMQAESIVAGRAPFCALADRLVGEADSPADFVLQVAAAPGLEALATRLAKASPGSLVASFFAQHYARRLMDVDRVLDMDLRLAEVMAQRPDFAEGVRAVLVDKDHAPRWSPASLAEFDVETDAGPILKAVKGG